MIFPVIALSSSTTSLSRAHYHCSCRGLLAVPWTSQKSDMLSFQDFAFSVPSILNILSPDSHVTHSLTSVRYVFQCHLLTETSQQWPKNKKSSSSYHFSLLPCFIFLHSCYHHLALSCVYITQLSPFSRFQASWKQELHLFCSLLRNQSRQGVGTQITVWRKE